MAHINSKLRVLSPDPSREAVAAGNTAVTECILDILRIALKAREGWNIDHALELARLPLCLGSFGMADPLETAPITFLAGAGEALPLLCSSHHYLFNFFFQQTCVRPINEPSPLTTMDLPAFRVGIHHGMAWVKETVAKARPGLGPEAVSTYSSPPPLHDLQTATLAGGSAPPTRVAADP